MSIPEKDASVALASRDVAAKSSRAGEADKTAGDMNAQNVADGAGTIRFEVADLSYSSRISSLLPSPFKGITDGVSYGRGVPADAVREDGIYTATSPEHPANVVLHTHEMTKYERKIASLKILKEEKALLDRMADIVMSGKADKGAFKEAMAQFKKGAYNGREADGMFYISTVNEVMEVINKKLLKYEEQTTALGKVGEYLDFVKGLVKCGEKAGKLAKIGKHLESLKELVIASILEGEKGALTASSVVDVASLTLADGADRRQEYSGLQIRRDVAQSKISTIKKGLLGSTVYVGNTALDVKPANPSKYAEDLRAELTSLTEGTMEIGEIKRVALPSTGRLGL